MNGHGLAKRRLAQAVAADGIKVLLTGEGADELLFGYRHFQPYFSESHLLENSDPAGLGILLSTEKDDSLGEDVPYFFHSKYALGAKIREFLSPWLQTRNCFRESLCDVHESELENARQAWLESALSRYILETLGDGTEMASSVEGRPPFLDHHVWELCSRQRVQSFGSSKFLLRDAMEGEVIEEIRTKAKHPFMAPPLGAPLREKLRERILFESHSFVDKRRALSTLDKLEELSLYQQAEWEPALLWILSSYYLQELWK